MTTVPLDSAGTILVTARGALAGADAGDAAVIEIVTGRYFVQADGSAWLTTSGAAASVQGVQLSPLVEGVEVVVRGAVKTYFVRARSALDTKVTFTRIGES